MAIIDITKHTVRSSDLFFFDNNVWIYIFGPIANSNKDKQGVYSSFLRQIQSARATIFINSLVIAEFANFCLRLGFKQWKEEHRLYDAEYKRDYIQSDHYKESIKDTIANIKAICKTSERHPDDFNAVNFDNILNNSTIIDFNDSYYSAYCVLNNLKIVTDDKDFQKISEEKLQVITQV